MNILNNNKNITEYLYRINYNPKFEESLCILEMKSLFNTLPKNKSLICDTYVDPSRSPYIKEMISIIYKEDTLEKIISNIVKDNLSYNNFKVCYVKLECDDLSYANRLKSINEVGYVITGFPDIHNPEICVGLTKINDTWILGEYSKNDFEWHIHDRKPYSYSNSLSTKVARSLVNIGIKNDFNLRLVDPCCGVGTVVIEALSMGIDVSGFEINTSIAQNAQKNLAFFGYDNVISNRDMHEINNRYDVAIIDLPYGVFTKTTLEAQIALINSARKIADKLILVTFEDLDEHILNAGFTILEECSVAKGKFIRYIKVCI